MRDGKRVTSTNATSFVTYVIPDQRSPEGLVSPVDAVGHCYVFTGIVYRREITHAGLHALIIQYHSLNVARWVTGNKTTYALYADDAFLNPSTN